jgi:hypothetical protein
VKHLYRISLAFAAMACAVQSATIAFVEAVSALVAIALRPEAAFAERLRLLVVPVIIGRDEVRQYADRRFARAGGSHARAPLSGAYQTAL